MKVNNQLIPRLFRSEYSKIVSILCYKYGLYNIQIAEDIASDTFLKASETWGMKSTPENPTAWLYRVAFNLAKDYHKRTNLYSQKIAPELKNDLRSIEISDFDPSEHLIEDSQLQMMFAICDPNISIKSQITFTLRILCGFGIKEISNALLTNKATINKRLVRTKQYFKKNNINLQILSGKEITERLDSVLSVLYLLFNEGYYSSSSEKTIQKELCLEAMRLLYIVLNNKDTNISTSNALMSLFCFQASRFESRFNSNNEMVLYEEQDTSKWNNQLIEKGEYYLKLSSKAPTISKYHLEGLIAYWHTRIDVNTQEKWDSILQLYNQLITIEYSPITALSRTFALSKVKGKEKALSEALKINLKDNHLYHTLLSELYNGIDHQKQIEHLKIALELADTNNEKNLLLKKLVLAQERES